MARFIAAALIQRIGFIPKKFFSKCEQLVRLFKTNINKAI